MIVVPPRHCCIISNPVLRKSTGKSEDGDIELVMESFGFQPKLQYGDQEIRFESFEPFPLYPGEELTGKITPLRVVE
jgi:major vault protein